jgi:hypothetical protein
MPRFPDRTGLALIGALSVALTGGCARTAATPAAALPAAEHSAVPAAQVAPVDLTHLRQGPADPQIGVAHPFDLFTHCGIEFARFGGQVWQAASPRPEPQAQPNASGDTAYTGYTAGTMTLVGTGVVRFVIDVRYAVADETVITFFPTTGAPPPCK